MADIISDFLERAQMAKGDPQIQAALAAEFALAARPEPERATLHAGLDAAALLHWFDADLLELMLEVSADEALERLEALKTLPFVERYRRGSELQNVHEATRLGWRRQMAHKNPEGFRGLSNRAAACFAEDRTPVGRIEHIYHLLCADPDRGVGELEELSRDCIVGNANARPEDYYALAAALQELEDTGLVQGRARASTLLIIGWGREMRGETAQLGDLATEALRLARDSSDRRMESEAQCLLGDVLQDQGKPAAAQAAFAESLAVRRRLSEQDPGNADWQRELAVTHSRVGGVLQRQGKLDEAQEAFDEYLAISRRLAEKDPDNAVWQRELALAHGRVGGVLQAQKRPKEARAEYDEYLAISRRLVEAAPDNAGRQRELAVAHNSMGVMLQAQEQLTEARAAFDKSLTISRRLAEQDPGNADLQRGLAVACLRLARVERRTSDNETASKLYEESLRIFNTDFVARAPERKLVEEELKAFRKEQS